MKMSEVNRGIGKIEEKYIKAVHGGGGRAMSELLSHLIQYITLRKFKDGLGLDELDDAATLPINKKSIVFTTDSYTVKPLFFPGGDIGKLSISGTINDLAVMGAEPVAISIAFIIGEGFPINQLKRIIKSINIVSTENSLPVVTGDTKVIDADIDVIINTTGIGIIDNGNIITDSGLVDGDRIIISGTVGDHGIAIMSKREGIEFNTSITSDCSALWDLIRDILKFDIHAMKDPTRGGIANSLNELAEKSRKRIIIYEDKIPIRREVKAASEMLGIDPLTIANEGKVLIGVSKEDAESVLEILRKNKKGRDAEIIGVVDGKGKDVVLETIVGGRKLLEKPYGDPVPRIC